MRKVLKYVAAALVLGLLISFCTFVPVQALTASLRINGVSSASGIVGSIQTLSGSGFNAGDSVQVSDDGIPMVNTNPASIFVGSTGGWTATITIPASPSGITHIIEADDLTGNGAQVYLTILPSITVSVTSALIGTSITVTGTGFQNAETNIITTFDNVTTVGSTVTASASGGWTNAFSVPGVSPGAHTIHAIGNAGIDTTVGFTVISPPRIAINPTRGIVGSSVTVSGTNFSAGETGINVTFGNYQIGQIVNADGSGAWTQQFNLPEMHGGTYSVGAAGNTTAAGTAANVSFTVTASMSINPAAGSAGTSVAVSGTGFGANENNIAVSYDGVDQGSTVRADSNGSWTNSFSVPVSSGGSHNISAHGQLTSASAVPSSTFKIGSGISINKNNGPAGTSVTISGSGFAANEASIAVNFDGIQLTTTTANANGNWNVNAIIPATAGGDHSITAKGKITSVASGATFTVTPTLSADKVSGNTGTTVTVTGAGFAANETGIVATFDGVKVGQTVTASATGGWTLSFPVPPASSGTHIIAVNGSVTQSVSSADLNFKISAAMFLSQAVGFPGSQVIVTGSGFATNTTLQITFDDNPISNIGAINTNDSGNFSKTITIPVAKAGSHVIKVIDGQNNSDSKTYNIDGTPPATPKLISPADGEKEGFFGGITPTFKWAAVTDQKGDAYTKGITYNFQIDTDSDFSNPVVDLTGLIKTSYTLDRTEALPEGQYYWHVQAIDAASNASAWSQSLTLTSGTISAGVLILIILAVLAVLALIYFLVIRRIVINRRRRAAPQAAPEIVIPEVVNAEYRMLDVDDPTKKKALPWRLALPQAPAAGKGPKTLSAEDQARLKTLVDFARSLPLVEVGPDTKWLVDLAENDSGSAASPTLYSQMLSGEIPVKYEPAWMRHPTYLDLQTLLEGQPILQDLTTYIETVDRCAAEAIFLLQDVYRDASAEITLDIFASGCWSYISAVYTDAFSWFRCKYLREPSEREYSIKAETAGVDEVPSFSLNGEPNTPFPGRLILAPAEADAVQLRTLHIKLRRNCRNSEKVKELAGTIAQLEFQRKRLLNAFTQFNRLGS
jgi:hypothetical protein